MSTVEAIYTLLSTALQPEYLEVIDDSEEHLGHSGATGGKGHYTVIIKTTSFSHQTRLQNHRRIYEILDNLMVSKIHALHIIIQK